MSAEHRPGPRPIPGGRTWVYVVVAVVIVGGTIVAGLALTQGGHRTTAAVTSGVVLVPEGTLYALPVDSYNAIEVNQNASSTVQGTITNVDGVQLYILSPPQYLTLVKTYQLTGYEWTSGVIANDTYAHLDITLPAGSWDLVFTNPYPGTTALVGFYTNLTLEPS